MKSSNDTFLTIKYGTPELTMAYLDSLPLEVIENTRERYIETFYRNNPFKDFSWSNVSKSLQIQRLLILLVPEDKNILLNIIRQEIRNYHEFRT
jgi:hypothetical protein